MPVVYSINQYSPADRVSRSRPPDQFFRGAGARPRPAGAAAAPLLLEMYLTCIRIHVTCIHITCSKCSRGSNGKWIWPRRSLNMFCSYRIWQALDSLELIVEDVGVFLDTSATHSVNLLFFGVSAGRRQRRRWKIFQLWSSPTPTRWGRAC